MPWRELCENGLDVFADLSRPVDDLVHDVALRAVGEPDDPLAWGDYTAAMALVNAVAETLAAGNLSLSRDLRQRLFEPVAGRPVAIDDARRMTERLRAAGFSVSLPKQYLKGGALYVPTFAEEEAGRLAGVAVTALLDIGLQPAGAGFEMKENRDPFLEYFCLELDQRLVFVCFDQELVHFVRAFDAVGKSVAADFVTLEHDERGDAHAHIVRSSGQMLHVEFLGLSAERVPSKRNLRVSEALPILRKRWPQIVFTAAPA